MNDIYMHKLTHSKFRVTNINYDRVTGYFIDHPDRECIYLAQTFFDYFYKCRIKRNFLPDWL